MEKFDWVVVANGSQARILERSRKQGDIWREIVCLIHPGTRAHGNDSHGNTKSHSISGRRSLVAHQDPKEHHRQIFCKQIADKLEEGSLSHRVGGINIFASSSMMGELLNKIDDGTKKLISKTHQKDLTSLSTSELSKRLLDEFDI